MSLTKGPGRLNLEIKDEDVPDDLVSFSADDLANFVETYVYKGFNRAKVRADAKLHLNDKGITIAAAASALRGPKKAASMMRAKIPATGHQGEDTVTYAKILAAYPERAASVLKRIKNLPKRIPSSPVPAFLQFPSAASLPLDHFKPGLAQQHKEWAREFSKKLPGGVFKEDLYDLTASDTVVLSQALFDELKAGL
jgi:hypothetical protein